LSLSPGFRCVDFRKFFQHDDNSIRPSKLGIALSYDQSDALLNAAATFNNELDGFKAISTCWHATDNELEKYSECTPFKSSEKAVPFHISQTQQAMSLLPTRLAEVRPAVAGCRRSTI